MIGVIYTHPHICDEEPSLTVPSSIPFERYSIIQRNIPPILIVRLNQPLAYAYY